MPSGQLPTHDLSCFAYKYVSSSVFFSVNSSSSYYTALYHFIIIILPPISSSSYLLMTNPLSQLINSERMNAPRALLNVPGKLAKSKRVTNSTGYNPTVFAGKEAQLDSVMDEIDRQGFIPESLIENETKVSIIFITFLLYLNSQY